MEVSKYCGIVVDSIQDVFKAINMLTSVKLEYKYKDYRYIPVEVGVGIVIKDKTEGVRISPISRDSILNTT